MSILLNDEALCCGARRLAVLLASEQIGRAHV